MMKSEKNNKSIKNESQNNSQKIWSRTELFSYFFIKNINQLFQIMD